MRLKVTNVLTVYMLVENLSSKAGTSGKQLVRRHTVDRGLQTWIG